MLCFRGLRRLELPARMHLGGVRVFGQLARVGEVFLQLRLAGPARLRLPASRVLAPAPRPPPGAPPALRLPASRVLALAPRLGQLLPRLRQLAGAELHLLLRSPQL